MAIPGPGPEAIGIPPLDSLNRLRRNILFGSGATVTLAAWVWSLRTAASPHPCHVADGWAFASSVVMWQAMMVAMMLPAVLPWLFTFAALTGRERGIAGPVTAFAGGYFVVWLGYSILGAALQAALQASGLIAGGDRLPARLAGPVLIASGLVYFTPLSRACLKHCRNPLTYFLARWDNRPPGGFRLGASHGAYCVGCCWALMLTGFAMGLMNMAWMALLTVLIAVEKVAPRGERIGAIAAAGMILWGAALLIRA